MAKINNKLYFKCDTKRLKMNLKEKEFNKIYHIGVHFHKLFLLIMNITEQLNRLLFL